MPFFFNRDVPDTAGDTDLNQRGWRAAQGTHGVVASCACAEGQAAVSVSGNGITWAWRQNNKVFLNIGSSANKWSVNRQ
jgi:hypothetical protein